MTNPESELPLPSGAIDKEAMMEIAKLFDGASGIPRKLSVTGNGEGKTPNLEYEQNNQAPRSPRRF